jgi:DNA (cytosine-5)-methyltransferase 1
MKVLDLFSGIGGFSLGLERAGMKTVAFCEIDKFCRKVLAHHWPSIPIYEDIKLLTVQRLNDDGINIDVICGGFPCQDISTAGKGEGLRGERSGLWREYARLIGEIRPRYVIVENVAALLFRGLSDVLGDLASLGYDAEWHCIPASYIGAPHRRDRVWIVAYPNNKSQPISTVNDEAFRLQKIGATSKWSEWSGKSEDVRMDDGLSNGMDRLKSLGNAVVPQIPEILGKAIISHALRYAPRP